MQARPERPAPITLAVIGGTGAYAGIRGEGRWTVARTGSRLDLELAKVAGGRTEGLMWVESDTRTQSTAVPGGDFLGGIGSLKGKGPDGRFSGQVMIGMGLLRAGVDAPQVEATVIEHQLPGGTILIAGVTGSGQWPLVRPVVGGTGEYAGAIGTATLERVREGVYRKTVAIWR